MAGRKRVTTTPSTTVKPRRPRGVAVLHKPFSLVLCAALGSSASAIVIRHDRDDALYRRLARRYRCVCKVSEHGHGTLVASRWVLTASHVAQDIGPFTRYVVFGKRTYQVRAVYLHPSWVSRAADANDLALLELVHPVRAVAPAIPYPKLDEMGKGVVFVGSGATGNGNTGIVRTDGLWRAAENRVERTTPTSLRFHFDRPPAGSRLEGISGSGDSGGPALLEQGGRTYVLGTSSQNRSPGKEELRSCTYGTEEVYGRVSTALSWIRLTKRRRFGEVTMPQAYSFDRWPQVPLGEAARVYLEAFNNASDEGLARFGKLFRTPASDVDDKARRKRSLEFAGRYGRLTPVAYACYGYLELLCRSEKGGLVAVGFFPPTGKPSQVEGVAVRDVPPTAIEGIVFSKRKATPPATGNRPSP